MPRITISYRRDDSGVITGRIFDRLVARYGREPIFRDIDDVPYGVDFRTHIDQVLASTNVLVAVIGPNWAGPSASQSRLSNEADPVRVEIETALRKGLPLIPVLVLGAVMPTVTQLPESLRDFAYRNAVHLDAGQDFDVHMDRLIRAVDRLLSDAEVAAQPSPDPAEAVVPIRPAGKRRPMLIAGSAALVGGLAVAAMSAWYFAPGQRQVPVPGDPLSKSASLPAATPPAADRRGDSPSAPNVNPTRSTEPSEGQTSTTAVAPPAPVAPAPPNPQQPPTSPTSAVRPPEPQLHRFDGQWAGRFHCEAYQNFQGYSHPFVLEVKDSRITRRVDSPTREPGEPGYSTLKGEVDASGNAVFRWSGISVGRPAQNARPRGQPFSQEIAGKFDDDRFFGRILSLQRVCEFELTRYGTVPAPPLAGEPASPPPPASSAQTAPTAALPTHRAPQADELRRFAAERSMVVPFDLRILPPGADVPPSFARFSGTWVGDQRWNGGGRQVLFFVEAVEPSGRAAVVYSWGPPTARAYNQGRPGWRRAFGQIDGNTLSFETPPGWNYRLTLYDDDRVLAVSEPNPDANPPYRGGRMWLTRMP